MDSALKFDIYKDIQMRTSGEIFLGVVGPVRTGKSTFIKRFTDCVSAGCQKILARIPFLFRSCPQLKMKMSGNVL